MRKRGQINLGKVPFIVLTIMAIGILIGVGLYTLTEFQTNTLSSAREINETIEGDNATGATVAKATNPGFSMNTNVDCLNAANNTAIPDANITATSAGLIKCIGDNMSKPHYCGMDWKCTYTYNYGQQAWLGVNETIKGISKFPAWMGIIVVIIAAAIVLGIVLRSFAVKRKGI